MGEQIRDAHDDADGERGNEREAASEDAEEMDPLGGSLSAAESVDLSAGMESIPVFGRSWRD
jgi:hypothetical protein